MFWISYLNLLSTYLLKCSYPDCIDLMKYATATLETQLSVFSRNNNNCSAHSLYIYLPLLSSPLSLSLFLCARKLLPNNILLKRNHTIEVFELEFYGSQIDYCLMSTCGFELTKFNSAAVVKFVDICVQKTRF